jgi:hypothetical protein
MSLCPILVAMESKVERGMRYKRGAREEQVLILPLFQSKQFFKRKYLENC